MPDTYRLPDNPIARRLEAARVALEQERAAQEERDRANQAAVENLRAVLAAMDPPLEAHVRPPHPHYSRATSKATRCGARFGAPS